MEVDVVACSPSTPRPSKEQVDEMVYRHENGLDLWTGRPLEGDDADSWLRLSYRMEVEYPDVDEEVFDAFEWLETQCCTK